MNPFNQSRYRNEHTLGDSYKIVKYVHDKMDLVKMVADNISNFRSGNIELKGEGSLIYWKYTEGTAWYLLVDTKYLFSQLLQNIADIEDDVVTLSSDIAGNALAIESINTEAAALESRVSGLTSQGATNTSDIAAINTELVDIKTSITTLTGLVSDQATTLSSIADQLSTLQGTVTTQGLNITSITGRVTALESA